MSGCVFPTWPRCPRSSRGCAVYSILPPIPIGIGAHLAQDPALAPLVAARPGLRVPGAWDGFELAMRAICGQQITGVSAATRLLGKIVADAWTAVLSTRRYGTGEGLTHIFRAPKAIAAADPSSFAMPGRADEGADRALAKAISADPLILQPREAPAWSRRCGEIARAATRNRRMDCAIHRHARIARARRVSGRRCRLVARDGGCERPPAMAGSELLARADAWRPWRAYAALHLWASA